MKIGGKRNKAGLQETVNHYKSLAGKSEVSTFSGDVNYVYLVMRIGS